ncbi:hypothetical protein JTB14_002984 [Gonioctena quinquepunctata]|nr:hypothetical protein JTB14_002984 [Gonioctena quinquepunctata]
MVKARFIAANSNDPRLKYVVLRLGGFHQLISYSGSVCYPMDGSGWRNLINTRYAINSIEKMMTGHDYYRAVRAHILAHTALMKIVMKMITLFPDSESNLAKVFYDFDTSVILDSAPEQYREIRQKVSNLLDQLKTRGYTAKL